MRNVKLFAIARAGGVMLLFIALVIVGNFGFSHFIGGGAGFLWAGQNLSRYVRIEDEAVPLSSGSTSKIYTPVASGKSTKSDGGATIDMSNAKEGYIMAKFSGGGKIKLQITKSGSKTTYTYDLKTNGEYEVFPLTQGNGKYSISIFKNVSGNQYAQVLSTSVDVELRASTLPFLYPSQFVNFNEKSKAIVKSNELAKGAADQLAVVKAIYNYVVANTVYDTQKASSVKPGYLPVIDNTLSSQKGICFDYASLTAAMLRAQGIPTRLEVGYAGKAYHAWISVYVKDVGWINDIIYFDGKNWKLMDPTFASSGKQSKEIMQYIGNGSNYSTVYVY